ncbi:MAG TPA: TIGR00303 family protein [Cyanobacteria bacterium UBA11372]|nr:TIGR00303 family protein [Cyanobacteria bacterium UBA11372]
MSDEPLPIRVYTQIPAGNRWLQRYQGCQPAIACVLGFTETGLIEGISAAGATPDDRRYTAIADAEFLSQGCQTNPQYPLPPLAAGASPVLITRAVMETLSLPVYLFNAGLPQPPSVPAIDLGGTSAKCLTSGNALELATVKLLFEQGLTWGEKLALLHPSSYLILGECVVGGTTTALAVLTGLGIKAAGKVNSSHPQCNHAQKWAIAQAGLLAARQRWGLREQVSRGAGEQGSRGLRENVRSNSPLHLCSPAPLPPLELIAAVGDPMQVVVAGMAIAASRTTGVMLAGGTQMLAVYALMRDFALKYALNWQPEQIVVGTTRWVAEDPTGDTVGLAQEIGSVPLIATGLSFATSRYEQLQAYERGYVKEGVAAGASCIAASLYKGWKQTQLLQAIESIAELFTNYRNFP